MDFETEEQQVEAIKEWWRQNGSSVLLGLGIGVAIIVSWNAWNSHTESIALAASDRYEQVVEAMEAGDTAKVAKNAKDLRGDYSDSSFAALASLVDAKMQVEDNDLSTASSTLQWVIDNCRIDEIQTVARIRKARILLDLGKTDEALSILPDVASQGFVALVEEVRGDIFLNKNEIDKARAAYLAAQTGSGANSSLLGMKLDDIGLPKTTKVNDNKDAS